MKILIPTKGTSASATHFAFSKTCMQVVIRVRPPLPRELEGYQPFQNTAIVDTGQRKLTVSENAQSIQSGANAADIALVGTLGPLCIPRMDGTPIAQRDDTPAERPENLRISVLCMVCIFTERCGILQAYATYTFTFDWVYGPDSFQSEVYDKSAKGTVLSALQASILPFPEADGPCLALE